METKKYASLSTLRAFLDNLKNLFTTKEAFETHTDNAKMHVSVADRYAWDSANGHMNDDSVHVTASDKSKWNVGRDYLEQHMSDQNAHISEGERTKWNGLEAYADSAAAAVKNDLLNGAGEAYDTLKELADLISENETAIDALEKVAAGKADKEHGHSITEIAMGDGHPLSFTLQDFDQRIDDLDSGKADKATTLAGYGITDAYTKREVDTDILTMAQDILSDVDDNIVEITAEEVATLFSAAS